MDLYRLRYPPYPSCVGVKFVEDLLKCSEPPEGTKSPFPESSFDAMQGSMEIMFFSRQQIHGTFGTSDFAQKLLRCQCEGCAKLRRISTVDDTQYVQSIKKEEGSWLVAVLLYLGKMHLLYPLIHKRDINPSSARTLRHMEDANAKEANNWFQGGQKERQIVLGAWKWALAMFFPHEFDVEQDTTSLRPSVRPFHTFEDSDRFPYWDCDHTFRPGAFGRMHKFQVPSEYLADGAKEILKSYPESTEGAGRGKKYFLVRKMIASEQAGGIDDENSMESTMLRILTTVKSTAKENIITLIAAYQWRNHIHYVFPFVRLDLYQVLREHKVPKQLKADRYERSLRNHWLWEQTALICEALSTINTKLHDPTVGTTIDQAPIIAFHFDLKPANILVTENGVLKITDFGQSHIRPLQDGEETDGEWTGGDFIYQAPESKPTQEDLESARDSYRKSGDSNQIRVPLNYDVWSLGCIMVEIMTFILDPTSEGVQKLDSDREEESGDKPLLGFFKKSDDNEAVHVLKKCVADKLAFLKHVPQSSLAKVHYNAQVIGITEQMLCVDPMNRLSSSQVVYQLGIADEDYHRPKPEDELYQFMKSDEVEKPDDNYGEVGWLDSGSIMSYLDLNNVEVEIMELRNQTIKVHRCPCRMQVFLNRESEVVSTVVRKRTDSKDLPDFIICLAVENSDGKLIPYRREIRVKSSAFVPLYLYETDGYECAIITDSDGRYPTWKMTFSFNSLSDACGFQRTFLLHRCNEINPDEDDPFNCRNTFVSVGFTQPKTGGDLDAMKSDIVLQSWAKVKPLWVKTSSRRGNSHASISTHSAEDSHTTTCVVIFTKKSFVVIPITKQDKQYKKDIRKRNVLLVSPNTNFKAFNILKGAPYRLAGSAGLQNAPSILLEPSQFEISNLYRSPLERSISKMELETKSATDISKAKGDLDRLGWVSP